MLFHVYLFLSTLFLGLQGAAFYKYQINKLSQDEIVQVSKNLVTTPEEFRPMWKDEVTESLVNQNLDNVELRSPEDVSQEIAGVIETAFVQDDAESNLREEETVVPVAIDEPAEVAQIAIQKTETEDKDDIVIFDYPNAQKKAPKVAAISDVPEGIANRTNIKRNKMSQSSNLFNQEINSKTNNLTPMYYEGEFKFQVFNNINAALVELRSLVSDEEVFFDNDGLGSIVKNFTSTESSEMFQAVYPMSMPVNVKAYWRDGVENVTEVPILEQVFINNLYRELGIKGEWGIVLAKMKENIEYVDIEDHKAMVFLDENLQEVAENLAHYVLYLGIPAGSKDLKFIVKGNTINYPIYVTENVISYVDLEVEAGPVVENFSVLEKLPLGKENKDIFLDINQVAAISSDAYLEKEALNNFKFSAAQSIVGNKESIAFNIDGQNYFTDAKKIQEKVIIPSIEYINQILDTAKDASVACIIEIIPQKKMEYITSKLLAERVEGSKGNERSYTEVVPIIERHLDADGIFYPTHSDDTKRTFLLTEDVGMVMVKINYKDGTEQNYQYFCQAKDYHLDPIGE